MIINNIINMIISDSNIDDAFKSALKGGLNESKRKNS